MVQKEKNSVVYISANTPQNKHQGQVVQSPIKQIQD